MRVYRNYSVDTDLYRIAKLCAKFPNRIGNKYADIRYWLNRESELDTSSTVFHLLSDPNPLGSKIDGFLDLTLIDNTFWWADVCVSTLKGGGTMLYNSPPHPYFCTASPRNIPVAKAMAKIDARILGYVTVQTEMDPRRFRLYLVNGGRYVSTGSISGLNHPLVRKVQMYIRNQKPRIL